MGALYGGIHKDRQVRLHVIHFGNPPEMFWSRIRLDQCGEQGCRVDSPPRKVYSVSFTGPK